jgi:hypothetical protein
LKKRRPVAWNPVVSPAIIAPCAARADFSSN